jgi:hypothetical protein
VTALDWAAKIVEENGRELAESFLKAARDGDWRAAEALMSRIYGKPTERVENATAEPETVKRLREMSREERTAWLLELERRRELRLVDSA